MQPIPSGGLLAKLNPPQGSKLRALRQDRQLFPWGPEARDWPLPVSHVTRRLLTSL